MEQKEPKKIGYWTTYTMPGPELWFVLYIDDKMIAEERRFKHIRETAGRLDLDLRPWYPYCSEREQITWKP